MGPAAVAVEPLSQGKAQVITVLVSLPTGEDERPPEGQAGLALGSVLVSNYQRTQGEQISHLVMCPIQINLKLVMCHQQVDLIFWPLQFWLFVFNYYGLGLCNVAI